jgi:hypothetical protein
MGDTDVNMGGVEPEKPPLPYGILYPPPLPNKVLVMRDGQRHERDPDWSKDAKYYGARDDLWGDGFETRYFNHNDPSLKGHNHAGNHPDDWEVQYRLGNPSETPCMDVLAKWGLQVLDKAGFLNLDLGIPDAILGPRGRYLPKRPAVWKDEVVHPVFRQDMWKMAGNTKITDAEYNSLLPAVLLASAMLEDPTTMCLFHALATYSCHVDFKEQTMGHCTKLQVPDSLTEAEQASIHEKICDMRSWTHFYWEDLKELDKVDALAYTVSLPGTTASGL